MKSTPPLLPTTQNSRGFALISVLALVSLAALTATAFLASARLEKTAAMTTGDQTRLTLALDSGYHLASYPYTRGDDTWNWADFLVGEDADGVGYLYHATPRTNTTSGEWTNYALFSCATMSNIGLTLFDPSNWAASTFQQGGFASNRLNSTSQLCKMTNFSTTNVTPSGPVTRIPLLFSRTSPIVNWITNYAANPSTGLLSPTFRFAYFTEDPSGLIDAERMGGSNSRDTGTNPTEIALGEVGITNFGVFTGLRRLLLTPGMIEDVLQSNSVTDGSVTNPWRYLSSSLYSMNGLKSTSDKQLQAYLRIPTGLGYKEGDKASKVGVSTNKYLLNTNFTTAGNAQSGAMADIAAAITNNLRNFGTIRSGAMADKAYISNIAANIVDYVDRDSTPSVDNGANPKCLGIENIPWPNELFDRIKFTNVTSAGKIRIELKDYVEVWNMGNKTIPSGTKITINNNYDLVLTMTNTLARAGFSTNLNSFEFESGSLGKRDFALTNDLLPNGYLVLESSSDPSTRRLAVQLTNPSLYSSRQVRENWFIYADQADATANMSYTASISNIVIQKTISGRSTRFLDPKYKIGWPIGSYIFCNNLGYASQPTISNSTPAHTGGDPRAQLFLSGILYQQNYTNQYATPGGRNRTFYWQPGGKGNPKYLESEVNPTMYWPDGGHVTNSDLGGDPSSFSQKPTDFATRPETNNWVMKRNDTGTLTNIIELGNIYDPMQWGDQAGSGVAGQPGLWTNLTSSATNDSRFGGRNTLRIGRPEHSRFAWTNVSGQAQPNMQASAAALLDIFCADTSTDPNILGRFDDGNQININTAPPRVLRALAAGVVLKSDPAMKPSNNYLIPTNAIDAFVKGVTNFRAKYPFYSPSQLMFIGTDAAWPNTNTWPSGAVFSADVVQGTNAIFEWNDAAAEEWFSKIYALSKVQTRNYRIYVQAQIIRTKGTNTNVSALSFGTIARRYYDVLNQQNNGNPPNCSMYLLRKVDY